jgi:outer membrane protein
MKKIMLIMLMLSFYTGFAQQKMAYIEVEKILEKMPEFIKANEDIDTQVKQWNDEVDAKFNGIESLYQNYVMNESGYSDDIKKQKQDEIFNAEQNANEFKDSIFGNDGELYKLQEEKLKPIYDKVYDVTQKIAAEEGFDYVFEKSTESTWIYTNPALNLTDKVIKRLGLQ